MVITGGVVSSPPVPDGCPDLIFYSGTMRIYVLLVVGGADVAIFISKNN